MDVAGEGVGIGGGEGVFALKVDVIVVDELCGKRDQRDIAGEAAVVEPVDADGGDAIDFAGGVHSDDDEVAARLEGGGDFAVEGSEAALVIADALLVYPDEGLIVCSADVEEGTRVCFGLEVEVTLVPDDSLEAKESGVLGIPVPRDLECGGSSEVVLLVMRSAVDVGVAVEGIAVIANLTFGSVETLSGWLINEVVPVSIEGGDGAPIDTYQKRLKRLLRKCGETECTAGKRDKCIAAKFISRCGNFL